MGGRSLADASRNYEPLSEPLVIPSSRMLTPTPLRAIFLDRDGVINRGPPDEISYVTDWNEFEFLPGTLAGLQLLAGLGPGLLVVTNQRGIARAFMTEETLLGIHEKMRDEVAANRGRLDGVYYRPHHRGTRQCRKPATGLFDQARQDFRDIVFDRSIVVGDSEADLEAARTIGGPTRAHHDSARVADPCREVRNPPRPSTANLPVTQGLRRSALRPPG